MVAAKSPDMPGNIEVVEFDSLLMDFAESAGRDGDPARPAGGRGFRI